MYQTWFMDDDIGVRFLESVHAFKAALCIC